MIFIVMIKIQKTKYNYCIRCGKKGHYSSSCYT